MIRRWRNQWADKPRTADYALQVLSRVLAHAVDPLGRIAGNPCEGIRRVYDSDRSEIIWTDSDIRELTAIGSPELAHAVDLASHTGLRLGDLIRLSWSHVGEDAIVLRTGKSRQRREAIIPLYDELRVVLDRIPKIADHGPDHVPAQAVDRKRALVGGTAGEGGSPRPARDRGDQVLYRRSERARDRRDHGLGGGDGGEDHPPLRRPRGRHARGHRAAQRP